LSVFQPLRDCISQRLIYYCAPPPSENDIETHNDSSRQSPPVSSRGIHRFALLTAAATFLLLGAGGLVTSHGVGMAVPDWPNTFGYNMFFFPVSQWVGGVFYEHTHRLLASGVGLLTLILALWLHGKSARRFLRWTGVVLLGCGLITILGMPLRRADAFVLALAGTVAVAASLLWPRGEPASPWLRRLGQVALAAVTLQGVLGGLRVVLFKDQIGIFHATLAQLFFVLLCAMALFTSSWWQQRFAKPVQLPGSASGSSSIGLSGLTYVCVATAALILLQLILGATMRHQHAGLAVPDFPLAYGKLWPPMDSQSVSLYNQRRIEVVAANSITSFQIGLHMAHRLLAMCILGAVGFAAWLARRRVGSRHVVSRLALIWLGLIVLQAALGAATIWSNKAADVATAHVLIGALSLACGSLLSILLVAQFKRSPRVTQAVQARTPSASFSPHPSPAAGFE
jgi:heme a synthase